MNTYNIILIGLISIYGVLFVVDLKIFFYKRTMYKIHQKTGIEISDIYLIVAPKTIWVDTFVRIAKWIILIAILCFNWVAAVICLICNFVIPIILPEEDDYKNMQKMKKYIENNTDYSSYIMYRLLDKLTKE